jgi:hypothetical protein
MDPRYNSWKHELSLHVPSEEIQDDINCNRKRGLRAKLWQTGRQRTAEAYVDHVRNVVLGRHIHTTIGPYRQRIT